MIPTPLLRWSFWSSQGAVAGVLGLCQAQAATVPSSFATQTWTDLQAYVQAPTSFQAQDWSTAAVWVGGLGLGMQADHRVGGWIANHPNATQDNLGKTFEPFGQSASFIVLAGFAAQGYLGDDARALRTAQEGLQVSILGGLAVTTLKYTFGRARPSVAGFGADPHFFNRNSSFPSGHTAQAFGVATVIAENYGSDHTWVPYVAYGTACAVGWQRIYGKHHNPTDVIAGAAIGYYTAQWVIRRHRAVEAKDVSNWEFNPELQPDGFLLTARRTF